MTDTFPHDTSGGAASAITVRGRSGSTVGPSGSHYIIGPLQKACGPRKKEKTAMSHFWDTHHRFALTRTHGICSDGYGSMPLAMVQWVPDRHVRSNWAIWRTDRCALRARLSVHHPTVAKVPYVGQFGDGADAAFLSVWPGGKPDLCSRSFSEKYDRITRHEGEVNCSGPWVILLSVGDSAHMIGSCRLAHRHPHPQKSFFWGWRWRYSAFSLYENRLQQQMGRESSIPVRVGHFFFILSRISCLL